MIGKKISFEAVPKSSHCRSWADVGRQTKQVSIGNTPSYYKLCEANIYSTMPTDNPYVCQVKIKVIILVGGGTELNPGFWAVNLQVYLAIVFQLCWQCQS